VIRRWIAIALLIGAAGACGPFCGNGKLNLSNGRLNPTSFTCPVNAQDYGYDIKGTLDADNQTGKDIDIKSMRTDVEVVKLAGTWSLQVGDKSGADTIDFSPKKIGSGEKTTLKFTTPWTCSDSGTNIVETYADFKVVLTLQTSNGTYKANLPNHRMKMS
jgi:hypothetical protein